MSRRVWLKLKNLRQRNTKNQQFTMKNYINSRATERTDAYGNSDGVATDDEEKRYLEEFLKLRVNNF